MNDNTVDTLKGSERIDTREIIEAAQELRDEVMDEAVGDNSPRELDEDEAALLDFDDDEGDGITDYAHGAQLIREDCFEDYARELAEEVGAISGDEQWPLNCIDWERAASELQMDYSSVTFLGYDYLVRS